MQVKDYRKFSANDFALDDYFQSWVLHPDDGVDAFWRHWRSRHPEKAAEIDEAREILINFKLHRYSLPPEEVARLWKKIQQPNRPRNRGRIIWITAAAIIAIAVFFTQLLSRDENSFEFKTNYGETRTILLPDSSTVILNANSRISYKNNWDEQPAREVEVDGEAFFSVVHKMDDQPFKVKTSNGVSVEVLGTTFNIYHRSIDTKVVLNTGQISLSIPTAKKEKKILMKPGELVECKRDQFSKRVVDPRVYAAWTEKKIILEQTSLREMIRMANDNYGVKVVVASDSMLDHTVSGSMPISDAEGFVNQVASVFHLELKKQGNNYLLKEETK